ncbi:MAG: hypothetical protein OXG15_00220 [Gammaproteobacteria bacterium]|nr:hypothetical protein [Gammaproteobacteria bacterium]
MNDLKLLDRLDDLLNEKQKHYLRIGELLDRVIKDPVFNGRIKSLVTDHARCAYMQGKLYQEYLYKRYQIQKNELNESR